MTENDEWKTKTERPTNIVFETGNNNIGWKYCLVDKSLIAQIERQARQKLLEELDLHQGDIFNYTISKTINVAGRRAMRNNELKR